MNNIPKPKYEVGQTLYFIKDNKVYNSSVYTVFIEYGISSLGSIQYNLNPYGTYPEVSLFLSKEELLKSL